MVERVVGLAERRSVLAAARDQLASVGAVLACASGAELAELMELVDAVAAQAGAARVAVTAEAVARGVVAESGMNAQAWVRQHAPSLQQGGAGQVAAVARLASGGGPLGSSGGPEGGVRDPESPVGQVLAGVASARVSPALAVAVLREAARLDPLLAEEAKPTVTTALLDLGVQWGPTAMRALRPRLVARYGWQGEFDDLHSRLAGAARLSAPVVASGDLTEYQLCMTPEQAAVLEAAIGPLSAPAPNEETGERDLRPAGQRRVEALATVCRRSSGLDADASGADGAGGAASAVHVVMSLTDLEARAGFGEVIGSTATGVALSPEVLRRMCCEADLIPHVLGVAGEDLDLGRVVRLFTRAQRRRLWRRDRGCTYPGCTAPAAWARAHHVLHWADGGASDIDNAALLCQRHHTFVHDQRLFARVRSRPDDRDRYVVWDLTPGSYDRHLERLEAERCAADRPPMTPQRWRDLFDLVTAGSPVEARWAEAELNHAAVDPWADPSFPEEGWAGRAYPATIWDDADQYRVAQPA